MRLALLLLSVSAVATDYQFKKRVDAGDLQNQLAAAGITCDYIMCTEDDCRIANVSADPTSVVDAYVYTDPRIAVNNNRLQAIALVKKLRAGTITAAEQRELLGRLAFMLLAQ